MTFDITPLSLTSAAAALIAGFIACVVWRRRAMPGATSLALLLAAASEWSVGSALEYAAVGVPAKVFWSQVEYVGACACPVLFLCFALEYSRSDRWLTSPRLAALAVVPLGTLLLAATNAWHGWIWSGFAPSPAGHNLLIYRHGPAFWVGVIGYGYLALLAGAVLLARAALRFPAAYRRQALALLLGASVPWAGNVVCNTRLFHPPPGLDVTPWLLTVTGLISAWAIFRLRLFDLVPVAREALIETMADGVLLLDAQDRVVDLNPAARLLLPVAVGSDFGAFEGARRWGWPDWSCSGERGEVMRTEIASDDAQGRHWELTVSSVRDRWGRDTGRLVVLRDITTYKRAEADLHRANERLRAQLAEIEFLQAELRDQATRDPLTGLYNRRYLDEALERDLASAVADEMPLSIVLFDLDHFKDLNDRHGHKAGDAVLRSFGQFLRARMGAADAACRYGGEEFLVILRGVPAAAARQRAEQWRQAWQEMRVEFEGQWLDGTLSGGVASFPDAATVDALLTSGDRALYAAKAAGRNHVIASPRSVLVHDP